MLRFSANLSFLFQDIPFYDRIDAAAANGFRGVEYMSPYDYDVAEIKRRLSAHGLTQVLFNLPVGDFAKGERGFATDPKRRDEFRAGVVQPFIEGYASGDHLPDRAELERHLKGVDARRVEIVRDVCETVDFHGGRTWTLEVAVWDLVGRALGQPVHLLLGGRNERVDVAKLNAGLRQELAGKGLTFNQPEIAPFREKLRSAGFYAEWKGKYGDEAWVLLEKSVGKLS